MRIPDFARQKTLEEWNSQNHFDFARQQTLHEWEMQQQQQQQQQQPQYQSSGLGRFLFGMLIGGIFFGGD